MREVVTELADDKDSCILPLMLSLLLGSKINRNKS